jgi:hypothetical protein
VTPSRLRGKPPRVTNASKLVDVKSKFSSYGNALVSSLDHSCAHSLNPTQRVRLESTNLTKRGLGRATKAWSLLEIAWDLNKLTRNSTPLEKGLRYLYPSKEKTSCLSSSGTGQTGAPDRSDRSGPRHPQNLFLRN